MVDSAEPRAVTVALQKGGVGKTTVAINVAERLDVRGHDVLLVDLDQQGNATEGVGLGEYYEADANLGDVWDTDSDVEVHDLIRETEGMDVIPSHRDLDEVENQLRTSAYGVTRVRNYIIEPLLGDEYDYIIIDSPPSIGPLSDSALVGTENVLVPLKMREASISGFQRMVEQQLQPLRNEGGIDVRVLALVPNILEGDGEEKRIIRDIEESPWLTAYRNSRAPTSSTNHPDRASGSVSRSVVPTARANPSPPTTQTTTSFHGWMNSRTSSSGVVSMPDDNRFANIGVDEDESEDEIDEAVDASDVSDVPSETREPAAETDNPAKSAPQVT
nr:AAA family ATPase [Halarchaeum acidiphilum]